MNMFSLVLKCAAGSSVFVCVYQRLLIHSLLFVHFLLRLNFFCHCWLLLFYSYLVYNHKNSTYLHIWRVNKAFELINMNFGISTTRNIEYLVSISTRILNHLFFQGYVGLFGSSRIDINKDYINPSKLVIVMQS